MTAAEIHARFRTLPGSEQMASEFGIAGLMWWARRRRPGIVFEAGAGIGTLTAALLGAGVERVLYTEPNAWCQTQTVWNLWHDWNRVQLLNVPPIFHGLGFVVIDGDVGDVVYGRLSRHALVFFEGRRREQRRACRAALWTDGRGWCEAEWKPGDRSKGYAVILVDPTLGERLCFLTVRMREGARDALARLAGRPVGKRKGG